MGRLTTALGYMSVAGLICLQPANGSETGSYPTNSQPQTVMTGPVNTSEKVLHAVSNQCPSVVAAKPTLINSPSATAKASSGIQQVSTVQVGSDSGAANPAVFASHPIRRVKYSEPNSDFATLSVNRNYANLSSSSCEKLAQATPLIIDTTASAPAPVEVAETVSGPTYLEELNQLAPDFAEAGAETVIDSYVSELNSLLHGPSPWILARGEMLDLRPEEPEPVGTSDTYINELQSLVTQSGATSFASTRRNARQRTLLTAAEFQRQRPVTAPPTTYVIPQQGQGFCESPGSKTVNGLFAPLSVVGVSGNSTAPPEVPQEVEQMELDLPKNLACSYLESGVPGYYLTRGYGTRKAPRNTHKFHNNPLYFEDPNLERCGQSNGCLTTFTSAIQFATMAALLPYQTAADHPRDCVAALPDCPTCQSFGPDAYFPEWSWKAAAVQGAAVTGLIFIIP
ncbi:MAG: hypothetical protein ABJZ55_15315 [Fuerstiella sp.]